MTRNISTQPRLNWAAAVTDCKKFGENHTVVVHKKAEWIRTPFEVVTHRRMSLLDGVETIEGKWTALGVNVWHTIVTNGDFVALWHKQWWRNSCQITLGFLVITLEGSLTETGETKHCFHSPILKQQQRLTETTRNTSQQHCAVEPKWANDAAHRPQCVVAAAEMACAYGGQNSNAPFPSFRCRYPWWSCCSSAVLLLTPLFRKNYVVHNKKAHKNSPYMVHPFPFHRLQHTKLQTSN